MAAEQYIEQYGYLAVLIGTFLEGETILILGGIAAKLGHLQLWMVILAAFTGSLLGDHLYFFLGRLYGRRLLEKRPFWQSRAEKLNRLIVRWGDCAIIVFRFIYGLRTLSPFVFGMSEIRIPRFFLLNATGAALWATCIGTLGYLFGRGLQLLPVDLTRHSWEILLAGFVVGATIWLIYNYRSRRKLSQTDPTTCSNADSG